MTDRRGFVLSSLFAGLSISAIEASAQPATRGINQSDYLFWLDDASRLLARQAAEQFAAALDARGSDRATSEGLYAAGGRELQGRYTAEQFVQRISSTRAKLGPLQARAFQSVEGGFKMLPNLPEGEYAIVVFDVKSPNGLMSSEQFTLSRNESAGAGWKLVEYYVGDKAFYRY